MTNNQAGADYQSDDPGDVDYFANSAGSNNDNAVVDIDVGIANDDTGAGDQAVPVEEQSNDSQPQQQQDNGQHAERSETVTGQSNIASTDGDDPAAFGNRIARTILDETIDDGANERGDYVDPTYQPVNPVLVVDQPGTEMDEPNRWQPLAFDFRVTQNGIIADGVQSFVGSHWGSVRPFAMHLEAGQTLYYDPGDPPYLNGVGDAQFKANNMEVIRYSSWLDPDDNVIIDASPGSIGNNSLGQNDGTGHAQNPVTGLPYAANPTNRADFGRAIAEFWADGPSSETPPGHWNTVANDVVDDPDFVPSFGGTGPLLDPLEWDVKMYFTLNGATHDVAVAVWGCKRRYDYVRPICSIRFLGHNNQLPLEPGLVERITADSAAPGERHEHLSAFIGQTAIYAWAGEPSDPETEFSGAAWISLTTSAPGVTVAR